MRGEAAAAAAVLHRRRQSLEEGLPDESPTVDRFGGDHSVLLGIGCEGNADHQALFRFCGAAAMECERRDEDGIAG